MRKEDFKSITKEHIEFCKDLLSRKRNNCSLCPLSSYNAVNNGRVQVMVMLIQV